MQLPVQVKGCDKPLMKSLTRPHHTSAVSSMLVNSNAHAQSEEAVDLGSDVINVTEYAEEIHRYLREAEVSFPISGSISRH